MKKWKLVWIMAIMILALISCNTNQRRTESQTVTYEILDFLNGMNQIKPVGTIVFEEEEREITIYVTAYISLDENETLYFAPRKTFRDNRQYINDGDYFIKIGQDYVYLILIDNEEPKPNMVRYPDYDELIVIFETYIEEQIDKQG